MVLDQEKLLKFDLLAQTDLAALAKTYGIYKQINEIKVLHSLIVEMPSFPRVPDIVLRNEKIRAVGSTTAIEGNTLTQEQIQKAFDKADKSYALNRLEQEVQNSREVFDFLVNDIYIKDMSDLSLELLRQIHKITTKEIPHPSNRPGLIRTGQVSFGEPSLPSLFPDQASVEKAVNKFILWFNKKDGGFDREPVLRALMAHYYLSEIHPFFDGNGRTTRAVEAFALLTGKVIHPNFFYLLANFWAGDRDKYLAMLRNVRETGDATEFVRYGLLGLIRELEYVKEMVVLKMTKLMYMDYVHYLHREKKKKPSIVTSRMVDLLQLLVDAGEVNEKEFFATPQVRGLYKSFNESTRWRDLKKMVENELVISREVSGTIKISANLGLLAGLTYKV